MTSNEIVMCDGSLIGSRPSRRDRRVNAQPATRGSVSFLTILIG
jgi:hypothetical protein